jgi:hypothetical protein
VYCTVVRTEYNVFRMCTYVFTSFCTRENSSVLASWRRAPWARFLRRPGGRGTAQPPQDPWAPKAAPARGRTRSRPACPVYTSALPDTGRHSSPVRSVLSPRAHACLPDRIARVRTSLSLSNPIIRRPRAFGPDTVARECDPSSAPAGMADRLARTAGCTCMAAQPARQQQ